MSRPNLCTNGPKIYEKKKTLLDIVYLTARPEKKSSILPGYYMRGLPVSLIN
jgi:hypothetical protein